MNVLSLRELCASMIAWFSRKLSSLRRREKEEKKKKSQRCIFKNSFKGASFDLIGTKTFDLEIDRKRRHTLCVERGRVFRRSQRPLPAGAVTYLRSASMHGTSGPWFGQYV